MKKVLLSGTLFFALALIFTGTVSAQGLDNIIQPASAPTYDGLLVNGTARFDSVYIGKQGIGGVTFFNGTIINATTTEDGEGIPVTFGDDVRIDGSIFRAEVGGDNNLKYSDTLQPTTDSTYSLGTTSNRWLNVWTDKINGTNVSELGGGTETDPVWVAAKAADTTITGMWTHDVEADDETKAAIILDISGTDLDSLEAAVGSSVSISDNGNNASDSRVIGNAIQSTASAASNADWYGQLIQFSEITGYTVDIVSTGNKIGQSIDITDAGGTGAIVGQYIELEHDALQASNPPGSVYGINVNLNIDAEPVGVYYGTAIDNSQSSQDGHAGYYLNGDWVMGIDIDGDYNNNIINLNGATSSSEDIVLSNGDVIDNRQGTVYISDLEIPNSNEGPAASCETGQIHMDYDSDDCDNTGGGDGVVCVCSDGATNTWTVLVNY